MVKGDSSGSTVVFHINGQKHSVDANSNIGPTTALVDYIRDVANLKGTKVMCREGGCGACTVTAKVIDPATGAEIQKSVNACLTPVLSCDGWDISTVESLGNKQEGYHVIQNRLVNFHGTQCGYCTPGMVMNMHALLGAKKDLQMEDIEKNLDGNICRCTGYRPILDAFKSLAKDASIELQQKCSDIEDCATCPMKKANGASCSGKAKVSTSNSLKLPSGEEWVVAKNLENALITAHQSKSNGADYRFVAGNTSTGIFKNQGPYKTFIDINGIPELKKTSVDKNGIVLGGGTTLTETINLLRESAKLPGFEYGKRASTHLERVANVSVRNITRRYQNAHAYVNAGFLFKVNKGTGVTVAEKPRIVYGGVSAAFIHATAAELSLQGKDLTDEKTLRDALQALEKEVRPDVGPLESSPFYRIQLAKTLLYKTILEIIGEKAAQKFRSGSSDLERIITKGKQTYDASQAETNLYKSVPKYEGTIQASGEAEYTADIPFQTNELFGAFVLSTVPNGNIKNMDASAALKIPGVERFVTAKDIPGINDVMKFHFFPNTTPEPVFADDKVSNHGQALGLILATSKDVAVKAAKLVNVTYENVTKPVVNIDDAVAKAKEDGSLQKQTMGTFSLPPPEDVKVANTLKGTLKFGSQYHFFMETISVVCHPREDGIDIYCLDGNGSNAVALVLNIPTNSINVQVRRLGGGFGGKATRPNFVGSRLRSRDLGYRSTMSNCFRFRDKYEHVRKTPSLSHPLRRFDENGKIGSLKSDLICDPGSSANESSAITALVHIQNCYKAAGWEVSPRFVYTNTPSNTPCRAPGSVQAVAAIEWIMDHIANHLKKDPLEVRKANFLANGDKLLFTFLEGQPTYDRENLIPDMIENMKATADYEARLAFIETFNKVIQTVAQVLQIPMDRIKIKASNNFVAANALVTGGSTGSELTCYSAIKACEELRENLRPILEKLEDPSWDKLIQAAAAAKVKLTASYTPTAKDDIKGYDVWVLNATEVEIDVLTGEYKIIRTDLYEDVGRSLSPATGEPSTDAAFSVVLAMRNAIAAARADAGNTDWFEMSGPVSPEDIAMLCLTKTTDLAV
ncbi:Aldehyde oxidase 4 [Orchesella cincta]|uniref:Aldehyde oxidase 4 n=1 Tax=Orchesella cincta TaxID=48709 RepID=A0A1D2NL30_ORCCI|nr:Aldehyde oxidase 4 [Orchesella cincta]